MNLLVTTTLTGFTLNSEIRNKMTTFSLNSQILKNFEDSQGKEVKKITLLIVDDKPMILKAMKRIIHSYIKEIYYPIECLLIEANDGIECLLANYLTVYYNYSIDFIISDETMPYFSWSYTSIILQYLKDKDILSKKLKMFIVSAISQNARNLNYSNLVKNEHSKPLNKQGVKDIFENL
jgi:hypothetical protein